MSALRVELAPSPALAAAILALHAAAAAAAFACLPDAAGALIACGFVALGIAAAWSRALLASRSSVRALEIDGPKLTIELRSGRVLAAQAAERRYVSRLLVVIALRGPLRRTVLVVPDMTGADSFRLLRIWALWGRLPAPSPTGSVAGKQLPA